MPKETDKCAEFIKYVDMTARNLSLEVAVECVAASTPEECITKTKDGQADLVTLDGGDVFEAGKLRILASMMVLEAELKAERFYAIHCLETTLFSETTSRKASKVQPSLLFNLISQMAAVFIIVQIFFATRRILKIGQNHTDIPQFQ